MTRTLRRFLILLVIAGITAVLLWHTTRPEPVTVSVARVAPGTVEATVANTRAGTVEPCRRARLAPPQGGQVAALRVQRGERVAAGQILLQLWNEDAAAQLALARSEALVSSARADETCLTAEAAAREAQRLRTLREKGLAAEEALDRAATEARARTAACNAAQANAQVSLDRIRLYQALLARTTLTAPFAGIVAEITGETGEYITPSPPGIPTPPAIDLIDDSCLYVTAPIDEIDAPQIRTGMPARILLDAFGERAFPATVKRIAPYVLDVEKQARTVEVEVVFSHPEEARGLLPGYSADAEIILDRHEEVLRIPTEALLEGNRVLVFDPLQQVLQERAVTPGLGNWQYTEVSAGLSAGEQVVTSVGREGVQAGAHARAEEPPR